jgi:hypothetical protein
MDLFDILRPLSVVGKLSLLVTLFPLAAGVAYLIRPSEQRLALMRPISLAGIFSGLCGAMLGLMNVLRGYAIHEPPPPLRIMMLGGAESLVSLFVAFGSLTVAWLCVALGMRRSPEAP